MPAIIAQDWPTIFDPETCVRKGQCPLKQGRGPHEPSVGTLYFEQHGNGPEKIIFIMGYNIPLFAWAPQVEYFGRTGKHSVLVFDNRGVGNSDVPNGLYTTSQMAEDTIDLLDYVGWNDSIHVVGSSLGGMIAQELATRITGRIVSLTLCVTKAGGLALHEIYPLKGILTVIWAALVYFFSPEAALSVVTEILFPCQWLDSKNLDDPTSKQTNREIYNSVFNDYFKVAGHGPTLGNILSQTYALITHRVTAERHRLMATNIPKILIITGGRDCLVNVACSKHLAARMPEAEYLVWKDSSHFLHMQWPKRYNELLEGVFEEGRQKFNCIG
ncbi:alpha/beta-hydrolase [Hysterangium stoloniferum]|nr:alpha/beta-hydrolase [Hysterangium stoloniferum]